MMHTEVQGGMRKEWRGRRSHGEVELMRPASATAPLDGQEHADQTGGQDMNALSRAIVV